MFYELKVDQLANILLTTDGAKSFSFKGRQMYNYILKNKINNANE